MQTSRVGSPTCNACTVYWAIWILTVPYLTKNSLALSSTIFLRMPNGESSPPVSELILPSMTLETLPPQSAPNISSPVFMMKPNTGLKTTFNPPYMFSPLMLKLRRRISNILMHQNPLPRVLLNALTLTKHAQIQIVVKKDMISPSALHTAVGIQGNMPPRGEDPGISIFLSDNAHEPITSHPPLILYMPDSSLLPRRQPVQLLTLQTLPSFLVCVKGNPWVYFLYPYPYPSKPLPLSEGKGFDG